jgi:hypothetical protein
MDLFALQTNVGLHDLLPKLLIEFQRNYLAGLSFGKYCSNITPTLQKTRIAIYRTILKGYIAMGKNLR